MLKFLTETNPRKMSAAQLYWRPALKKTLATPWHAHPAPHRVRMRRRSAATTTHARGPAASGMPKEMPRAMPHPPRMATTHLRSRIRSGTALATATRIQELSAARRYLRFAGAAIFPSADGADRNTCGVQVKQRTDSRTRSAPPSAHVELRSLVRPGRRSVSPRFCTRERAPAAGETVGELGEV